jgi:hypothetical protein
MTVIEIPLEKIYSGYVQYRDDHQIIFLLVIHKILMDTNFQLLSTIFRQYFFCFCAENTKRTYYAIVLSIQTMLLFGRGALSPDIVFGDNLLAGLLVHSLCD